MMTEMPVLLPIEARGKYEMREYQVAVLQTCFFFVSLTSGTLWICCFLLNASIMNYAGWENEELRSNDPQTSLLALKND